MIKLDELFRLAYDCKTIEALSFRFRDCCRQKQIKLWILLKLPINPAASAILKVVKVVTVFTSQTSINWQPVIIRYQCRSSVSGKIEKQQKYRDDGAVKPQHKGLETLPHNTYGEVSLRWIRRWFANYLSLYREASWKSFWSQSWTPP